jgi:1-acyl-sn-glycerol-3-phosphate acyltransferase
VVQETIQQRITPLRRLTSPVFFSTNHLGQRFRGLGHLPSSTSNPLLIVGNHQLGALDIWLIVPELIQERDLFVRGLGHAVIFHDEDDHLKGGPTFLPDQGKQGTFGLYQKFGAVMATPKNLYRLLQTNQTVLHFPGGAREAYHGRTEAYQLFWPNQTDFVRMAAKFNATIVPLSGIGAADSVDIVLNPEEMLKLPFGMNDIVANSFLTVREPTRYNELQKQRDEPYIWPPPLIIPKLLPARHYFVFGQPFDTTHVNPRDREACRRLYQEVQTELYRGLEDLLRAREHDPFKDSTKRLVYEQVTGKQAPTFSIKEMNLSY